MQVARFHALAKIGKPGKIDQLGNTKWIDGSTVFGFENSLRIGTPRQIYNSYIGLQDDQLALVKKSDLVDFLWKMSAGHFGHVSGSKLVEMAQKCRKTWVATNEPCPEIDSLVLKSFRYTHSNRIPDAIFLANGFVSGRDEPHNGMVMNSLLSILGSLGRPEAAKELYSRMKTKGLLNEDTQLALLEIYSSTGNLAIAQTLFDQMTSQNEKAILALMSGYAAAGQMTMVSKFVNMVPKDASKIVLSRAKTCLIQAYAERGLPGDALATYREMRDQGLTVDPKGYQFMIMSHLAQQNIRGALKWFYKKENVPGWKPSVGMYAALVKVYLSAGDSIAAWKTVKEALGSKPRVHVPSDLVRDLCLDLKGKPIDYLRDRIQLAGFSDRMKSAVFQKLMQVAVEEKQPDLCVALYSEYHLTGGVAQDLFVPFRSHLSAMKAHGILGDMKSSESVFKVIMDEPQPPEADALDHLLDGYSLAKDKKKVQSIYSMINEKGMARVSSFESVLRVIPEESCAELLDNGAHTPENILHPCSSKCLKDNGHSLLASFLLK